MYREQKIKELPKYNRAVLFGVYRGVRREMENF